MQGNIALHLPDVRFKESWRRAVAELTAEGRTADALRWYYAASGNFAEYVADLRARPTLKTDQIVPETIFWGVVEDEFVGRISLRHELNEMLARVGGHIGYEVRPSFRGRGLASAMLGLVLPEARRLGLERVLLTCDDSNLPSKFALLPTRGS